MELKTGDAYALTLKNGSERYVEAVDKGIRAEDETGAVDYQCANFRRHSEMDCLITGGLATKQAHTARSVLIPYPHDSVLVDFTWIQGKGVGWTVHMNHEETAQFVDRLLDDQAPSGKSLLDAMAWVKELAGDDVEWREKS